MYYFRADGNAVTGAGHLMRCLTIAEELKKLSEADEICFLCADEASAELVTQRGFSVRILHTDYRNMEEELPVLGKVFGRERKSVDQTQCAMTVFTSVFISSFLPNKSYSL